MIVRPNPDEPPLERLPLGARLSALVIDLAPAFGPVVLAGAIGAIWFDRGSGGRTDLEPAAGVVVVLAALWPVVYFGRARTIGKARAHAWVAGHHKRRRLRGLWTLLPPASFAWPFLAPLLVVDVAWMLLDHRRALHDRLAGTEVLREVPESPHIRELRLAGAEGRRTYALAALQWALDHGAAGPRIEEIRSAVDAAADDPYEAQAAWASASNAVADPLLDRLPRDEEDELAVVDAELERLYEEADAAEEQARVSLVRQRA